MKLIFVTCVFLLSFLCSNIIAATHQPLTFVKKISGQKDEGKQIVQTFCATCHEKNAQIQIGAPVISEIKDWRERMKLGIKSLFKHTSEGFGAMPARGGCFECSDKQLMLAIAEMLPKIDNKNLK